jgi:uncharacterized protein (TIGR03435 family)
VVTEIGQPFIAPSVSIAAVHPTTNPVPGILFAVWLCGFLVVAFRWYARWRRVRATVRVARPVALELGVRALSSTALLEPGIFGIFRPVLVLPEGIADCLTREQLQAILAHELCHMRRRDNLFAALHMLVETIFWFHPLVWWIGARLVEERERACDEEVLWLGNEPEIYAEGILKTCRFYLESPLACMSGVTGADLKKRVVRIMTQRVGQRIGFVGKALLAAAGMLAIAVPLAFGLINAPQMLAQSATAEPSGPKPKFEVASIKRDKSDGHHNSIRIAPGGKLFVTNDSLRALILMAYRIENSQLIGGPAWINSDRFDIRAEAATAPREDPHKMSEAQLEAFEEREQLRLQALLQDRFQLKLHRETRKLPIYALIVAKHGPKLRETPASTAPYKHRHLSFSPGQLYAVGVPLRFFAKQLSNQLGRPVVDKSGLKGIYDFTLKWTPERSQRKLFGPESKGLPTSTSNGPSIFTALREQLGLKLKAERGPVEVLVIDHVERPSPN